MKKHLSIKDRINLLQGKKDLPTKISPKIQQSIDKIQNFKNMNINEISKVKEIAKVNKISKVKEIAKELSEVLTPDHFMNSRYISQNFLMQKEIIKEKENEEKKRK